MTSAMRIIIQYLEDLSSGIFATLYTYHRIFATIVSVVINKGNEMDLNQLSYVSELSVAAMYAPDDDARIAEMILKIWDRDGRLSADQFAVVKRIVDLYGK